MKRTLLVFLGIVLLSVTLTACGQKEQKRPILLQGAMDVEIKTMVNALENKKEVTHGKYIFYEGTIDGYPIVVSKTNIGIANAAASTTLGIEAYNPIIIINQGTAGGHDPKLHTMDVVIGENVVNMGAFKTENQAPGEGIDANAFELFPLEVIPEGKGEAIKVTNFPSDEALMELAEDLKDSYKVGQVVRGTIGSADEWNNQLDRIALLNKKIGTSAEEMETASVGQVAMSYGIPYLGIRVLSNTAVHQEDFNPDSAIELQNYVVEIVKAYIN